MPPKIELYETDDTTLAQPFAFGSVPSGTESVVWSLHLWNGHGFGGASPARNVRLTVDERDDPVDPWNQDDQMTSERWIEARAIGPVLSTPWTPIGRGMMLELGTMDDSTVIYLEVKIAVPAKAASRSLELRLSVDFDNAALALGQGFYESGSVGIITGYGDGGEHDVLSGLAPTASGAPDADVNFSEGDWMFKGTPFVRNALPLTFDNLDGNAASLLIGESYWATVSIDDDVLLVTKSPKGLTPLAIDARMPPSNGAPIICYVEVPYSLAIPQVNIYDERVFGRFDLTHSPTSFDVMLGRGRAMVGNSYASIADATQFTLSASVTTTISILPSGAIQAVESHNLLTRPDERSSRMWEVTTDATGVLWVRDLRLLISVIEKTFSFVPASVGDTQYFVPSTAGQVALYLPRPFTLITSEGRTTGQYRIDVSVADLDDPGSVGLVSIFSVDANKPYLLTTENVRESGLPDVTQVIMPDSIIAVTIEQVPSPAPQAELVVLIRFAHR